MILDVGCGTGLLLPFLTTLGAPPQRYRGIDLSPRMVEVAQRVHALPAYEGGGRSERHACWCSALAVADAALEAARLTEAHGDTAYALFLALGNARDAVDAGDLTAAKAALESGLTLAPTEALKDVVRLRLARLALAGEEGGEGALRYLEAIRQGETMAGVAELRGDALASLGAFAEARAAYAAALAAGDSHLTGNTSTQPPSTSSSSTSEVVVSPRLTLNWRRTTRTPRWPTWRPFANTWASKHGTSLAARGAPRWPSSTRSIIPAGCEAWSCVGFSCVAGQNFVGFTRTEPATFSPMRLHRTAITSLRRNAVI